MNRRRAIVACDVVRSISLAGFAAAVWTGRVSTAVVIAVAVVDAAGQTLFSTGSTPLCEASSPRSTCPPPLSRDEARNSLAAAVPVAFAVFLGPAGNAALFGYQAAITPDRLQGRVVSVIFLCATSAAAAAPVMAGLLVSAWNGRAALMVFAAGIGVSAVAATVSRGIRTARPIADIATTS